MISENTAAGLRHRPNATRVIAATVGVFCGIDGLVHGWFEILQGNIPPPALLSSAIGPAQQFWPGGTLHALTIIPSFLMTGILAILASFLVIVWSLRFIHVKRGALVFLLLSVLQFLVGGGFGQIFLVLLTAAAATRINAPLDWWRSYLPVSIRRFLAKIWIWLILGFAVLFSASIFAGIFGYLPLVNDLSKLSAENASSLLYALGYSALGFLLLALVAGFAHDIEEPDSCK